MELKKEKYINNKKLLHDMPKNRDIIALAPIERLFKFKGADRVSKKALVLVQEYVTKNAKTIINRAKEISINSNRDTVLERDVKLAESRFFK